MSGKIYLHPEKGVNPRLTICQWCGGDAPELVLVGNDDSVYICGNGCGAKLYGGMGRSRQKCPKCGQVGNWQFDHKLEEYEKLPGGPCDKCQKKIDEENERMAEARKEVEAGGVFWKCEKCGSEGAIKRTHPICAEVRKKLNTPTPRSCGVAFTPEECPVCNGEMDKT